MENILELKTINELQQYRFYIPSYQRGYRWSTNEVEDLLDDISKFTPRLVDDEGSEKTWYCLQPIVVKMRKDGQYEVIDGQQRLTTIYLILHYINNRYIEPKPQFELHYETRENSSRFLAELKKGMENRTNVDFYHISNAYKTICRWFEQPNFDINDFESKFSFNSKIIWYESSEEDPIAIFTRINIGKIPLTNSELIKALFLNSSNFSKDKGEKIKQKQLEISTDWDLIEHKLQDDRFWHFLTDKNVSTNRIEFIFDLMNSEKNASDNYSTFRFFNRKFEKKNKEVLEASWLIVKEYFQRFQEWFEERDLYHKIGYLVAIELVTIGELYEQSKNLTKSGFRELLENKIKIYLKDISLDTLQYGDKKTKPVLLLYNILTMLNNEKDHSYFPFELYKNEKWDIEHITSITENLPVRKKEWLDDALAFVDSSKTSGKIIKSQVKTCNLNNEEEFEALFKLIIEHFNEYLEDTDINDISNLTLLDSETNRGYKNAVFPLKRKTIIDREKKGVFIPLCTKNVFLKYFSDYPPKISFWTQEDRENYYNDLAGTLEPYIGKVGPDGY